MPHRVLLLDGYSLLFRAYFALPPLQTSRGEPTAAIYGFAVLLLKLMRELAPVGVAVALDSRHPTFRHLAYPDYKHKAHEGGARGGPHATPAGGGASEAPAGGGQPSVPPSERDRFDRVTEALGFPTFDVAGFEADDVLATLARRLARMSYGPVVVTGDHDLLQIAGDRIEVLIVSRGSARAERCDEAGVRARFGVRPAQLPAYRALVGDRSDNLPGVPGIGPRTAARLLERFGSLEAVLANAQRIEPARVRDTLVAHAGAARQWADLATLREDVPLPQGPLFGRFDEAARSRLRRLFEELEFYSLLGRLDALESVFANDPLLKEPFTTL